MDVKKPVKIIYVEVLVTPTGRVWPRWYTNWHLSGSIFINEYDVEILSCYDNNNLRVGSQIKFYDLEKYVEFCLRWM